MNCSNCKAFVEFNCGHSLQAFQILVSGVTTTHSAARRTLSVALQSLLELNTYYSVMSGVMDQVSA